MHEDDYVFIVQTEVIIEAPDNAKSGTGRIVRIFAGTIRSQGVAKRAAEEMNRNSDGPHYRVGRWAGSKEPEIGKVTDYQDKLAVPKGELEQVLEQDRQWLAEYRRLKKKRDKTLEEGRRCWERKKKSNVHSARKKSRAKRREPDGGIEF